MGNILQILRLDQTLTTMLDRILNNFMYPYHDEYYQEIQQSTNPEITSEYYLESSFEKSSSNCEFSENIENTELYDTIESEDKSDKNSKIFNSIDQHAYVINHLDNNSKRALREGIAKMKTRRSMTNVLKDIANVKLKLRRVPKSPGGRPVRLKPIPNHSNELYAILRRRYAAMHSPSDKYVHI